MSAHALADRGWDMCYCTPKIRLRSGNVEHGDGAGCVETEDGL